jgi:hypothetical protein
MDVHDTALIPRSVPLEPGMVITVEPGKFFVYISFFHTLKCKEFCLLGCGALWVYYKLTFWRNVSLSRSRYFFDPEDGGDTFLQNVGF